MDLTYVDEKNLKTLEEYAVYLGLAKLSLTSLYNHQVQALEIGSLTEELRTRISTILWDLRRAIKQCEDQLEDTLKLLPDTFNAVTIIEQLKAKELTAARRMLRKKVTKCDT